MNEFYLGTHMINWIERGDMPALFISRRRLSARSPSLKAKVDWCLDSGGFTELSQFGRWTVTPDWYIREVRLWSERMGRMVFAAAMDWMCEPFVLAKTGLSIKEHQENTVRNYLYLTEEAPDIEWLPVLQGFTRDEYLRCFDLYRKNGIELYGKRVGIGSICRRQGTQEAAGIIEEVAGLGLRVHGFGLKKEGVINAGEYLYSADSMAWSFGARYSRIKLAGCHHSNCANCPKYALQWYRELLEGLR